MTTVLVLYLLAWIMVGEILSDHGSIYEHYDWTLYVPIMAAPSVL